MSTGDPDDATIWQALQDIEHRLLTLENRWFGQPHLDRRSVLAAEFIQCGTCGVFCQNGASCGRADCPHPFSAGFAPRFTAEDHEAS